jgi:hypothetical protein
MNRHGGSKVSLLAFLAFALGAGGCALGPRALELSHPRYNDALKQVKEEQLLLNLVRLRYNDNLAHLDVSSIAAQYEVDAQVQLQPFFTAQGANIGPPFGPFMSWTRFLPFAGITGSNRPTISLTPMDDADNLRPLFVPATVDGIVFLSETSWPVSTVFRLWVEYLNRVPNAVTASGPPRSVVPEFQQFQRAVELLQVLQDAGNIRFVREERLKEMGGPLPEPVITSAALVDAAKNGFEYQRRPDKTWVLVKRDRHLELRVAPAAAASLDLQELCELLNLKPGLLKYEVTVGAAAETFAAKVPPPAMNAINIYPRSTAQAMFYMAHGVDVPVEHLNAGIVPAASDADGRLFDWQQLMQGLFTVHSAKQHCRPARAQVAVKYRGYWFYIDDRDNESKTTFSLMMVMTRLNLLGTRKGGPTLTLPLAR